MSWTPAQRHWSQDATVTRSLSGNDMTDRVRGLLITPDGDLLTVQRIRRSHDPYWVLPGGGVEDGEDLETALARELRETGYFGSEPGLRTVQALCAIRERV